VGLLAAGSGANAVADVTADAGVAATVGAGAQIDAAGLR